jgi:peptidoglycan hydrolase CwlO-like protein
MKSWLCALLALVVLVPMARAEDAPKPEQLKGMYDDAMQQLKAAQERKTQLATENEQLKAKVAELQKQLEEAAAQTDAARREAIRCADETNHLRAHYVAWQEFLQMYPALRMRWEIFLEGELLPAPSQIPTWTEPSRVGSAEA